jgi:LmbE family N-acetylglucosaminyl deacetylase
MTKFLILSPHTDDAELGCGGSIVKLIEKDHDISWAVFSTAEESLPANLPSDILKKEFLDVIKSLDLKDENYRIFNFKVRSLHEHRQEILEELINMRKELGPDVIVGPSMNDFHQDHQVIAHEMIRAFKTTASIICYELPWNHVTFDTQLFIKLEKEHIKRKFEMLKKYNSQLQLGKSYFSEEFIYGLAKIRGNQCTSDYAEAFEVVRWIL